MKHADSRVWTANPIARPADEHRRDPAPVRTPRAVPRADDERQRQQADRDVARIEHPRVVASDSVRCVTAIAATANPTTRVPPLRSTAIAAATPMTSDVANVKIAITNQKPDLPPIRPANS